MEFEHEGITFKVSQGFGPFEDGSYDYSIVVSNSPKGAWSGRVSCPRNVTPAEIQRKAIAAYTTANKGENS